MKYTAKGYVLGIDWGYNKGAYPTIKIQADSIEDLDEAIKTALDEGYLDNGFGFQKLLGAVMEIQEVDTTEINGKLYSHCDYFTKIYGENLLRGEIEFLWRKI